MHQVPKTISVAAPSLLQFSATKKPLIELQCSIKISVLFFLQQLNTDQITERMCAQCFNSLVNTDSYETARWNLQPHPPHFPYLLKSQPFLQNINTKRGKTHRRLVLMTYILPIHSITFNPKSTPSDAVCIPNTLLTVKPTRCQQLWQIWYPTFQRNTPNGTNQNEHQSRTTWPQACMCFPFYSLLKFLESFKGKKDRLPAGHFWKTFFWRRRGSDKGLLQCPELSW